MSDGIKKECGFIQSRCDCLMSHLVDDYDVHGVHDDHKGFIEMDVKLIEGSLKEIRDIMESTPDIEGCGECDDEEEKVPDGFVSESWDSFLRLGDSINELYKNVDDCVEVIASTKLSMQNRIGDLELITYCREMIANAQSIVNSASRVLKNKRDYDKYGEGVGFRCEDVSKNRSGKQ